MSENILSKIRKLNWVMSESTSGEISFDELYNVISELLHSNVYILGKSGRCLAAKFDEGAEKPLVYDEESKTYNMPTKYNDTLLTLIETKENLTYDAIKVIYSKDYPMSDKFHTIVPINFCGSRVATMIVVRQEKAFSDEDIAICEYGAIVIGMEVARTMEMEQESDERNRKSVKMALETLSYSELEAMRRIFDALNGDEGLLVASKVADESGITRSVIVNALRKLESAGVIESRSLGMKGTRIKILNPFLRQEIVKIDF